MNNESVKKEIAFFWEYLSLDEDNLPFSEDELYVMHGSIEAIEMFDYIECRYFGYEDDIERWLQNIRNIFHSKGLYMKTETVDRELDLTQSREIIINQVSTIGG